MTLDAFFISPTGEIIPVPVRHIVTIAERPSRFGITETALKETFDRHHEPVGSEMNARNEIIAGLIEQGWMRLRYDRRSDALTVQVQAVSEDKMRYLGAFAQRALQGEFGRHFTKYTDVLIKNLQAKVVRQETLGAAASIP